MSEIFKKNIILTFSLIAFLLLFLKNILPFIYYPGENILLTIINQSSGSNYLPIIKSYSDFNLSPLYDLENSLDNKNLAFPYLALFIHSISLKIFGPVSFIFLEFFASIIFLIVIYRILLLLNFNKLFSILMSSFFFILPEIFSEINYLINTNITNILNDSFKSFYNIRLPRPLITNLYFFIFTLILLKIHIDKNYSLKRSIFLGFIIGLSLHSFFYFVLIEFFIFLLFILFNYKKNFIKHIIEKKKFYINLTLIISFFLILFFMHIKNASDDNSELIGLHNLDIYQKINLLKYFTKYVLNEFFLILFFANFILYSIVKKIEKNLIIIYLLYISSIISFLFFIIFVNKSTHYYFFQNWIAINGLFFFIIAMLKIINFNFLRSFFLSGEFFIIILITILFFHNFFNYTHYEKSKKTRLDEKNLIVKIENDQQLFNKNDEILLFDTNIFTYLTIKDFKNFTIVPNTFWTSRNFNIVENNIINSFNILGIDKNEFINIFKNEHIGNRIINNHAVKYFGFKYLANNNINFNDTDNYTKKENEIISLTSPFVTQIIMPQGELLRIKNRFIKKKNKITKPKIIILNNNSEITKKHRINMSEYCLSYANDTFIVYKNILYCK